MLVPNPPGWFAVGDHAIAGYDGKLYDPSYGSGPFDDIRAWAIASLAGYARLTERSTPGGRRRHRARASRRALSQPRRRGSP